MQWSPQQARALAAIRAWLKSDQPTFILAGYAGTGKTEIAYAVGFSIANAHYCAPTGKASDVLRQRGCEPTSTIHRLIYRSPFDEQTGKFRRELREPHELNQYGVFIIDEGSMIDAEVAHDLRSFRKKTLIIIDPGQLPPVNGVGYFSHLKPDAMLTEIHRQARDNPILRLADDVRRGRPLWGEGSYDGRLIIAPFVFDADAVEFDTVLCGKNDTRRLWNKKLRMAAGFTGSRESRAAPQPGEVIVCLRNDYSVSAPVFNGQTWEVVSVGQIDDPRVPILRFDLEQGDQKTRVKVPYADFFGDPLPRHGLEKFQRFDFGYTLTVHKAQGSEWERVLLFNESGAFGYDARKWLYTGVTRAKNHLTIVKAS